MKNDAQGVSDPAAHAADAMAHLDPVRSLGAFNWACIDRENDSITLAQRYNFGARLHAWALLCEDKLTACKVAIGFGQEDGDLEWKDVFAV